MLKYLIEEFFFGIRDFFFILVIYFLTFSFIPGWFWGYKGEETNPPAGLCCSSLGCQSARLQLWCAVKMAACVCV